MLAAGVFSSPARAQVPNYLSGEWANQASLSAPAWTLVQGSDQSTLMVSWHGGPGPHASLLGTADLALVEAGSAWTYTGPFTVTEAGNTVTGRMNVSPVVGATSGGRLVLDIHLGADNGAVSDIKFEQLSGPPEPSGLKGFFFEFFCPALLSFCRGKATFYGQAASAGSLGPSGGTGRPESSAPTARRARTKRVLGSKSFSVAGGRTAKISVALNKAARKRLAKAGKLTGSVQITVKPSSGLPPVTTLGTVTFRK